MPDVVRANHPWEVAGMDARLPSGHELEQAPVIVAGVGVAQLKVIA